MLPVQYYVALYKTVFRKEVKKYDVSTKEINTVLRNTEIFLLNPIRNTKLNVSYDDPACRCAYLKKYAAFHTHIIHDMFNLALRGSKIVFMPSTHQSLSICSIGGGPGIDIIAVLSVLQVQWGFFRWSAQTIENVCGWKDTLASIVEELQNDRKVLPSSFAPLFFDWTYSVADQLGNCDSNVKKIVCSANLLIMPKFGSTVDMESARLIKLIFDSMCPGALFFFIGNAYGGYNQLVSRLAQDCSMVSAYGPSPNILYENTNTKANKRFDTKSCFGIIVSCHLLMKPYTYTLPNEYGLNLFPTGIDLPPNNFTTKEGRVIFHGTYSHYKYTKGAPELHCLRQNPQKWIQIKDTDNIRLDNADILDADSDSDSSTMNCKQVIKSCLDDKSNANKTADCSIIKLNNTKGSHYADHDESCARNNTPSAISCTDVKSNASEIVDSVKIKLNYADVLKGHIKKVDTDSKKIIIPCAAVKSSENGAIVFESVFSGCKSSEYNQTIFENSTIKANSEPNYSKPNLDQIALSPNPLCSSELEGLSSGHNYPLYEMFPKGDMNILPNGNSKSNQSNLRIVKSSSTTTDDSSAQTKSILNDGVEPQDGQKCKHCTKLRRISWLQNKCSFCKN